MESLECVMVWWGALVTCRYCWRNSNEWSNDMVLCLTTLIEKNAMNCRGAWRKALSDF